MEWIKCSDRMPDLDRTCWSYLVSGHEFFGIACWEKDKGWTELYFGEYPSDRGQLMESRIGHDLNYQGFILYWAEIPDYPIR